MFQPAVYTVHSVVISQELSLHLLVSWDPTMNTDSADYCARAAATRTRAPDVCTTSSLGDTLMLCSAAEAELEAGTGPPGSLESFQSALRCVFN